MKLPKSFLVLLDSNYRTLAILNRTDDSKFLGEVTSIGIIKFIEHWQDGKLASHAIAGLSEIEKSITLTKDKEVFMSEVVVNGVVI